jgi:hypothetical protein
MMDKIEIPVELLREIQKELRNQRLTNIELHSQLDSVKRILNQVDMHLPRENKVEEMPPIFAAINQVIEKHLKKDQVEDKSTKTVTTKKKP